MNTQQRPFFQAAKGQCGSGSGYDGISSLRLHLHRWIAVIMALLFFGCASLTTERISVLVAIATQAAQLGAQEWLKAHPEHRAAFQQVIDAINVELKAGNVTKAIAMLHSLPVTSLSSKEGEVYWTGEPRTTNAVTEVATTGTLIIWDGELAKAVRVTGAAERPIVVAVRDGLRRAVAPMPPALPVIRKHRTTEPGLTGRDDLRFQPECLTNFDTTVPVRNFRPITPEPPAKTDAELDAEFQAIKAKLKTPR